MQAVGCWPRPKRFYGTATPVATITSPCGARMDGMAGELLRIPPGEDHARNRVRLAAVRRVPPEAPVGSPDRRSLLRPLGTAVPLAPGIGRTVGGSGPALLRRSGTLRQVRGLAAAPGRTGPPNLLRPLPRSNGLAPASHQYGRGREGPYDPSGRSGATAVAHQNPTLLLSHRVLLRGLGAPLLRVPRQPAGWPSAAGPRRSGSRLPDASGRTPASLSQHAEPGDVRHSVPVPRGAWAEPRGALAHAEGKARPTPASRPEHPGNGRLAGCHARPPAHHGRSDLRRRVTRVGVL